MTLGEFYVLMAVLTFGGVLLMALGGGQPA